MNFFNIQTSLKHNIAFGFDAGLHIPEIIYLNNLDENQKQNLYFDTSWNIFDDIAIRDIPGSNIKLVNFFNGKKYTDKYICINNPYAFDGEQGHYIGENALTLFKNKKNVGKEPMNKIKEKLTEEYVDYIEYDCIYKNKFFYFKKITLGLSEYLSYLLELFNESDENFIAGLRLNLWNPEMSDIVEEFLQIKNIEYVKQSSSFILHATGRDIGKAWKNLYKKIPDNISKMGIHYLVNATSYTKNIFFKLKRESVL